MIEINHRDSRPIYEQIRDKFTKLIVTGVLSADEKMPSVRELASTLAINPNTIQRAYRELESQGLIYSVAGKGSFVSKQESANAKIIDDMLARFDEMVSELDSMGISRQDLIERMKGGTQ